jgi:hypothetical protein
MDLEIERRKELLQLYRNVEVREPIEFTSYSMKRRRQLAFMPAPKLQRKICW